MTFSASATSSRATAKWARIAHDLDQEFGPVPAALPMLDGESVEDWRARQRAAIEAEFKGRQ